MVFFPPFLGGLEHEPCQSSERAGQGEAPPGGACRRPRQRRCGKNFSGSRITVRFRFPKVPAVPCCPQRMVLPGMSANSTEKGGERHA